MKRSVFHIAVELLLLLTIFVAAFALSFYHGRTIESLKALSESFPTELPKEDGQLLEQVTEFEKQLKKAGTSLAFFTHYEQLNEAYLSCSLLRCAVETRSKEQYSRALVELKEALGTLLRNDSLSVEAII
jgi:hypothetical protein